MAFTLKTKVWNQSFFIFVFLTIFSFGFLAIADEQEAITTFFEDVDQDGLSTDEEKAYGTDPSNNDTDGDSYSDGVEIESGYDPLKPAPGDRVVSEVVPEASTATDTSTATVNLTEVASQELADLVAEKQSANEEITNDDLTGAVATVLEQANQEVELPEVDIDKIKIKELEKKLDESEKEKQRYEDTVEYLTTIGYILASNAPATIRSQSDVGTMITQTTQNIVVSLASGNYRILDELKQRVERTTKEIEAVEVPEHMLGTHVKALRLTGFLTTMGDKIKAIDPTSDPMGQMLELSKMQGAIFELQRFYGDVTQQLAAFGLSGMSLDFISVSP